MRKTAAIVCLIAVTFVGINLVISHGSLDPVAIGFTLFLGMIVTPVALITALVYERFFLKATHDPAGGTAWRLRVKLWAPIAFAVMAIVPSLLWRHHVIAANSWWLIFSPMWAALCLYSLIMGPPREWLRRPGPTHR
jgi:hypothetical protein